MQMINNKQNKINCSLMNRRRPAHCRHVTGACKPSVIPSCRYDMKNYINICILETSFLHRHFFGGIRQQLCGSRGSKIHGWDALWDLILQPVPPGCRRSGDESRQSANQARCTKVCECDRGCAVGQLLCSVQKCRSDLGHGFSPHERTQVFLLQYLLLHGRKDTVATALHMRV